ncbi:general transcription factor 3C polypeptide 1 [Poeciliopsis prolifica]|uniref:general transcription factor 3C polypeptide 1 n=1 Tax=Poeciliopsis prolifica TaxID=188132 RepID=UPI002414486D|nr:general transcription factor 3C polypeptide 1 [Poeciliopsis prolifica]
MDALSVVVDEVALEGLDGITLPTLWIRLEDREPKFPLKLDGCTKGFIWRSLVSNADLSFYELPEEREDVELFDRFKDIDPETGCETQKQKFSHERRDVYPLHVIPENKDGIQGSCVFFKERKNVTKQIRSKSFAPLVNLEEAQERYGRKLVVVASQALRFRTLIGSDSDPESKISNDSYCVLERVGRGRWQGELQSDLHGSLFKIDARKMHYLRKCLVKHELITMQSYVRRLKTGQQQHSILLLLKRFHVNRRNKYDILMEHVSDFLLQLPDHFTTVDNLKEHLNLNEKTLKRLFKNLRYSKLVEFCQYALEDLDPSAEHCTNKNGSKVLIRCIKLLKPYGKKTPADFDDDDEDDDDYTEGGGRVLPSEGRIMERDIMSQAYHIILSSGTKGVPHRDIGLRMNVGRLESRMICRKMDRDGVIKSFMEDEGRQRTTKFISHKCASASDQLQLFAKEQERNKLLSSSASHKSDTKTSSTLSKSRKTPKAQKGKKAGGSRNKDQEEDQPVLVDHTEDEELNGKNDEADEKCGAKRREEEDYVTGKQTEPDAPDSQSAQAESESPSCSGSNSATPPDSESIPAPESPVEGEDQPNSTPASSLSQSEAVHPSDNPANAEIVEIDSTFQPQRSHETYRLLKRKNMIVEAIQSFKIIEGFFPLQKIINDAEKKDGVSSKCCKKTVLRLVHNLSREGLLKLYSTTVIQDGVTKKVDIIAHPSIQPSDGRVSQLIEQIRFRISSSYAAGRLQVAEEKREQLKSEKATTSKAQKSVSRNKMLGSDEDASFKPTPVPGLGKTLGFQPKMIRLRAIHSFLWYLIYGHPLRDNMTAALSASQSPAEPSSSDPGSSDPGAGLPESQAKQDETSNPPPIDEGLGDEEGLQGDQSKPDPSDADMKVYADEDSWRRFIPPVPLHKGFTSGWAMVRSLLLCLPLSIFVQIVQINYKVDELEDYLSDSVKQHYLVRALPARMKRQLLYKRKYIFAFHENLQKLAYMGLVQFGVVERFKDKDQVFLYLKRNASIVDTTTSEPHYWLVQEPPDSPFERRQYTFNTAEDVESFWFDLMCVCLNTPLGVVRSKRNNPDDVSSPPFVHDHNMIAGMSYLLKGSYEVCDDGSVPGDGRGAAGLDSELFSHLKRNWLWTCHLLTNKPRPNISEGPDSKLRLKSLLSRNSLRMSLQAGKGLTPCYLTNKRTLIPENVEMGIESVLRNKLVVGGKGQTRKRKKTEVIKAPRKKKKEPKKRSRAHDATDHQALKRMTRHRVYWSVQEDSVMMLCSVASHLLNSKIKRPFVPHCVVRDLLHAEFDISKDKTSVAVGRRTRYILKNPQTLLNYRICLAEVHQDKALMRLLEKNKPADPDQADDCAKAFSEYVRLLRQKFSTIMFDRNLVIPDSQEQIFARFKVSAIDSGKYVPSKDIINCKEDIHAIVLHNLIQSSLSMTNGQMKSFRSFQTFHTYSKYNPDLLCRVFIQCKKRRMFNRRRISKTLEPKKNRGLPMLPMSFQMSQTYYRHFVWRFPFSLCTDSFCFLRNLITRGPGADRPTTAFYHEPENRSQTDEEVCDRKTSKNAKHGSETEPQIQTAGSESTDKVDNNQSVTRGEEKSRESEEKFESTEEKSQSDEQKDPSEDDDASSSREQTDESPNPPDLSDMLQFPLSSPGGACLVSLSLMTLGWLNIHVSIPKQIVVVDSSLVDNEIVKNMASLEEDDDDDDNGDECDGRKKLQVNAHQASHTNYLLMRGYCSPGIVKLRNLNMNDNIVVESCILNLSLRDAPAHHIFCEQTAPPLELTKSGPSLLPPVLTRIILSPSYSPPTAEECDKRLVEDRQYSTQDIEACARLRRSLDEAGEKGLDERDLHVSHLHLQEAQSGRTRSLQQYLKDLQEEGQVVRVGSLSVRWVLMEHAEPWLLTVNCKQMSQPHENAKRRPHLTSQYNFPFARKRCIKAMQLEAEGPPAKKPASDKEKQTDRETWADGTGKPNADDGTGKPNADDGTGKPNADDGTGKPNADDGTGKPNADDGTGKPNADDGTGKPNADDGTGKPNADDGTGKPNADDGTGKPNADDGTGKPNADDGTGKPNADDGTGKPNADDGTGKPNADDGTGKPNADDGTGKPNADDGTGKPSEAEQQKEQTDNGSGDKTLILETGKEMSTQPEQEGEEMETEQEQVRPRRFRKCRLSGEKVEEAVESPSVDTEENLSFISRPWRFIDGKVNRPVCKAILEAVLYHIMSQPGLTQQTLLEHYKDALQPVTVLDIVQALLELGCVTKRTLVKDPKPSLFRSSAPASRGSTVATEEPDTVFYEPTISCCLRLCRVLPNERHWNNNLP